jgi:tetraprenyl-beta-curcumene synthase
MTGWRDATGVLGALAVYKASVLPGAQRELAAWREIAAVIPDSESRRIALGAIDEKGLNVEATAVFAILAPRRTRPGAIRAMVALQVAIDYLDSLGERPSADPLGDGLRLHATLTGASAGDDPYLGELVAAYESALAGLPSRVAVATALERAIGRCGEGQARTHAAEHDDRAGLEAWARAQPAPVVYRWWEVAAGASSSVAAHALIAAAADPRTSAAEAERIDAAYFPPIGALTVLLDDLVDRDEDAAADAHNYLAYYGGSEDAAARLDLIAHLARAGLAGLRHHHRHAAILAGVAGFYLSAAEAETAYARPVRERLLRSAGPAVRPIVAFMRLRRRR